MSYSKFTTLTEVLEKFGLGAIYDQELFPMVSPAPPGALLVATLAEYLPLALAIGTEKARSELLIMPVLAEVRRQLQAQISLFSGVDFNVDAKRGLNGYCDYLLSRSRDPFAIQAPVFCLVEAKNEKLTNGLGQCVAEMLAAQLFNARQEKPIATIYGAVTTGELWRFIKLEGTTLTVDKDNETLNPLERLLGILTTIATGKDKR
jgi:hypothetical protein